MRTAKIFLLGLGVGSGATFFFDPQKGPRRRALMRDQAIHVAGEVREQIVAVQNGADPVGINFDPAKDEVIQLIHEGYDAFSAARAENQRRA